MSVNAVWGWNTSQLYPSQRNAYTWLKPGLVRNTRSHQCFFDASQKTMYQRVGELRSAWRDADRIVVTPP